MFLFFLVTCFRKQAHIHTNHKKDEIAAQLKLEKDRNRKMWRSIHVSWTQAAKEYQQTIEDLKSKRDHDSD